MSTPMQQTIDQRVIQKRLQAGCFVFFVLLLAANSAFSGDVELTNFIVRNSNDQLQVDLRIKGIFNEEMKAAVSKGLPINLTLIILLYEIRDYWFDLKIIGKTALHDMKYDVLKKEYRIERSWEKRSPLIMKDFKKAQSLFLEIKEFDVIAHQKLKKGKHYQLRVKLELNGKKFPFAGFPWEFETDWYTLNFIY
jgi:hypothetical protein